LIDDRRGGCHVGEDNISVGHAGEARRRKKVRVSEIGRDDLADLQRTKKKAYPAPMPKAPQTLGFCTLKVISAILPVASSLPEMQSALSRTHFSVDSADQGVASRETIRRRRKGAARRSTRKAGVRRLTGSDAEGERGDGDDSVEEVHGG
jgi:hypothetical protein